MAKIDRHHQLLRKEVGKTGQTEVTLPSGSRLDVLTGTDIGKEIELNNDPEKLQMAASRLREALNSRIARKVVLKVPQPNMPEAVKAMKKTKVPGTVSNLKGSKVIPIPKPRATRAKR